MPSTKREILHREIEAHRKRTQAKDVVVGGHGYWEEGVKDESIKRRNTGPYNDRASSAQRNLKHAAADIHHQHAKAGSVYPEPD